MIRRIAPAAVIVLLANAFALVAVARNGGGSPDATVTLTERELRLVGTASDNTGMTLLLSRDRQSSHEWFTREKLSAIGFDCSVDPDSEGGRRHYDLASLPRGAYVVLHYDPAAQPIAAPPPDKQPPVEGLSTAPARTAEYETRLRVVDVGNDRNVLRAKYADRSHFIITRGIVRARLLRATPRDRFRIEGWVMALLPGEVYVPREMQATIASAVGKSDKRGDSPLTGPPRYEVTLQYGSALLPRVVGVRRIVP